jgi:VWFA-related protein
MKNSWLSKITKALFWTLLIAVSEPAEAQQPTQSGHPITVNTDLVVTWAQITNPGGAPVKGLGIDDLTLREDGKQQQITLLRDSQPLSVVLLVQAAIPCNESFSLISSFQRSREALQLFGDAEIALMVWDTGVALVQPFTTNWSAIADHLADRNTLINASYQAGRTPTSYELPRPAEGVYQAARYLEQSASPERRKVIISIFIPQLINKTHLHSAAEVSALLDKTGATVYGLYQTFEQNQLKDQYTPSTSILSVFGIRLQDKKRRAGGTIEDFTEQTGGSILVGKAEQSDEMLIKLAGLIRSSYTIGYYPENSNFDGRFRRINLELSLRGKTKVGRVNIKTRNGYMAVRSSSPNASEMPPNR